MKTKVLIVDDDQDILDGLSDRLLHLGYKTDCASSAEEGLKHLKTDMPDLVLLDLSLPGMDGLAFIDSLTLHQDAQASLPHNSQDNDKKTLVPIIVMTAFGTIEKAVSAVKAGAFDFLTKPFDIDHLAIIIKRALRQEFLQRQVQYLQTEIDSAYATIIGVGQAIISAKEIAQRAAQTDATVLLLGETGTGKELFARTIHRWSSRRPYSFMAINCAGIPETLLENELFGHEQGAFTGADRVQKGKIEAAESGTVFLDEIGDMPLSLQTRLLRLIQDREFHRVGGVKSIKTNVRFVAATNRDLQQSVKEHTFREDLYYRLNVVSLTIPPLRDRPEDIPQLAGHFVTRHTANFKKPMMQVSEEALQALQTYSWPGNIRELDNVIARAVLLNGTPHITTEFLGLNISTVLPPANPVNIESFSCSYHEEIENYSRQLICRALEYTQGNKSQAAKLLQLQRTYFVRLLKKKFPHLRNNIGRPSSQKDET